MIPSSAFRSTIALPRHAALQFIRSISTHVRCFEGRVSDQTRRRLASLKPGRYRLRVTGSGADVGVGVGVTESAWSAVVNK